jgi:predicted dehydrogenase
MRVAIIGAGLIGLERIQAIVKINLIAIDAINVVMVVDLNAERLAEIKTRYGVPISTELPDLFAQNPDWVFICTPHIETKALIFQAFSHNCNVLVEKPLGRSLLECSQILKAKPSHVRLYVGFNYRFFSGINKIIDDANNGTFGKLISVNMTLGHGNSPGMEQSWKLNFHKCGGGCLIDPGIHLLDLVHCISDGGIKVKGGSSWAGFWATGVEEEAHLIMSDSAGVIYNLQTSLVRWKSQFRLEINGEDGYGIVEGRGRSYGPQSYRVGRRWAWLSGETQKESEELIIENDDASNSFFVETALLLGLRNVLDEIGNDFTLDPCNFNDAFQVMQTLEDCRTLLGLPTIEV